MNFEDTKLPDCPVIRFALQKAQFQVDVVNRGKPQMEDKGMGPGSLALFVRAGQILHETVPAADAEHIAGAVLFLNFAFQEPSLIQRVHSQDLPMVCAWAQEWRDIDRGGKLLECASLELRQIIAAANTAIIEGIKNNLPELDADDVRRDLAEKDNMARQSGDLRAPALAAGFKEARDGLEQLLKALPPQTGLKFWRFGT